MFNIAELTQRIRQGKQAERELPLVREMLQADQEMLLLTLDGLVGKRAPESEICQCVYRLCAVRSTAKRLVGAILAGDQAEIDAQRLAAQMGPPEGG